MAAYYLHPPDARAIFLYNDLLCKGTCSVTGVHITYWGGGGGVYKRKRPKKMINRRGKSPFPIRIVNRVPKNGSGQIRKRPKNNDFVLIVYYVSCMFFNPIDARSTYSGVIYDKSSV